MTKCYCTKTLMFWKEISGIRLLTSYKMIRKESGSQYFKTLIHIKEMHTNRFLLQELCQSNHWLAVTGVWPKKWEEVRFPGVLIKSPVAYGPRVLSILPNLVLLKSPNLPLSREDDLHHSLCYYHHVMFIAYK